MKLTISILITAVALLTHVAKAQQATTETGGTTFGLRAGVNFQNINGEDADGRTLKNNLVTRYHIGVNAEIPVAPDFFFQPGLLFSTKGAESEQEILGVTITGNYNIYYLELPLNFIYKPLLGSGHLILGFGPYLAYGMGGNAEYEGAGVSIDRDIKFKNSVSLSDLDDGVYFKPLDAGANLLAGYEFSNRLSFQLNAQLGLVNMNPSDDDKPIYKNTGFGLSLGYRF